MEATTVEVAVVVAGLTGGEAKATLAPPPRTQNLSTKSIYTDRRLKAAVVHCLSHV